MSLAVVVAAIFLALIALAHLVRLALGVPVLVGHVAVPGWMSAVALLFAGTLAILLWRERRR